MAASWQTERAALEPGALNVLGVYVSLNLQYKEFRLSGSSYHACHVNAHARLLPDLLQGVGLPKGASSTAVPCPKVSGGGRYDQRSEVLAHWCVGPAKGLAGAQNAPLLPLRPWAAVRTLGRSGKGTCTEGSRACLDRLAQGPQPRLPPL